MNAAAALLLDMTLKASLLCALGFALAAAGRRASGAARHDLWAAVIACCAVLPLAAALLRALGLVEIAPVHSAILAVTPALPQGTPAGTAELIDRIWSGDGGGWSAAWVAPLLVAMWAAGAAGALIRTAADYRAARDLMKRARPFGGVAGTGSVRLLATDELDSPAMFGIRSPVILLPRAAETWPAARLGAVVAHERSHIGRRDGAWELVIRLSCALHWYNPFVHMAARALRSERELACDEIVVAAGHDPHVYAGALVEAARAAAAPNGALIPMAQRSQLERRVTRLLLRPPRPPRSLWRRLGAGLVVALVIPAALATAPAAGVLAPGSVQPEVAVLSGLDDPMSELVPLPYEALAARAAAVPAEGAAAAPIRRLQSELAREPHGYGDLVRQRAIWTLVQIRDGRLVEPLAEHVRDSDWRVRAYAAWGLAAAGDRRATPLLARMLDDPVWRVRAMAAAGLAELADPAAAGTLIQALGDPAWQVRISGIRFIDRLGDRRLARRLRPLLRDPHAGTRMKAEEVLARF